MLKRHTKTVMPVKAMAPMVALCTDIFEQQRPLQSNGTNPNTLYIPNEQRDPLLGNAIWLTNFCRRQKTG